MSAIDPPPNSYQPRKIGVSVIGVIRTLQRWAEPEAPVENLRGQKVCRSAGSETGATSAASTSCGSLAAFRWRPFLIMSTACF